MFSRDRVVYPGTQRFWSESFVCLLPLEIACVGALYLLLWVLCQFMDHTPGMGHIEDDQALCQGRKIHGELPCDGSTPVVTDDNGFSFQDGSSQPQRLLVGRTSSNSSPRVVYRSGCNRANR